MNKQNLQDQIKHFVSDDHTYIDRNIARLLSLGISLPNRLMTEFEVAEAKRCSVQRLRNDRHLCRGLPYIKDGRNVRYSPADVATDILQGRISPEAA